MKKESWKIMFACAVGAFIGSLIALELKPWLIWVGLIAGGLVGYLAYDFRRVISVIPAAYRAARGWRPNKDRLRLGKWFALNLNSCSFSLTLVIGAGLRFGSGAGAPTPLYFIKTGLLGMAIITVISVLLVIGSALGESTEGTSVQEELEFQRHMFYCTFLPIVLFYHLPRGLWWMAKRTPRAIVATSQFIGHAAMSFVRFFGRFGWQVFIRIHSERRVLCFTDAVIGSVIGYVSGSAIVGALCGALVGLVNYELVTRRWLMPRGYVAVRVKSEV